MEGGLGWDGRGRSGRRGPLRRSISSPTSQGAAALQVPGCEQEITGRQYYKRWVCGWWVGGWVGALRGVLLREKRCRWPEMGSKPEGVCASQRCC